MCPSLFQEEETTAAGGGKSKPMAVDTDAAKGEKQAPPSAALDTPAHAQARALGNDLEAVLEKNATKGVELLG